MTVTLTPVSVASTSATQAEVKSYLRVDTSDDNDLIDSLNIAAENWAQTFTKRQFLTATKYEYLDNFVSEIRLPHPPLASVTSIQYVDADGDTQTLDADTYTVDTTTAPGRIYLAYGETWPTVRSQPKAITITYVCGYGAAASVPENLKTAIKLLVNHWYENRLPVVAMGGASVKEVPKTVDNILYHYHVMEF